MKVGLFKSRLKRRWLSSLAVFSILAGAGVSYLIEHSPAQAQSPVIAPSDLQIFTRRSDSKTHLKSLSLKDLGTFKRLRSREKDPASQQVVSWKGVSLASLVDKAMSTLSVEEKAYVDLVIVRNDQDERALIPRAFINKYPLYLAMSRDGKSLGADGPLYSVAPWTSNSRIRTEGMSLEALFVPRVSKIELTNYRDQFGAMYLKRRTDPAAIRGEKLFVQNCLACHHSQGAAAGVSLASVSAKASAPSAAPSVAEISGSQKSRNLASSGHPAIKGAPKLESKDIRALTSYLDAYRAENGGATLITEKPVSSASR